MLLPPDKTAGADAGEGYDFNDGNHYHLLVSILNNRCRCWLNIQPALPLPLSSFFKPPVPVPVPVTKKNPSVVPVQVPDSNKPSVTVPLWSVLKSTCVSGARASLGTLHNKILNNNPRKII